MRTYREVVLNHEYVSAKKYAKDTGAGYQDILHQCKNGTIEAYQTDGGQWRVKIYKSDMVTRNEYEELQKENERLKNSLDTIKTLVSRCC